MSVFPYHKVRVFLIYALACLLAVTGTAAAFPQLRSVVAEKLGSTFKKDAAVAVNSCTVDQASDSDTIYFLSCGGIY